MLFLLGLGAQPACAAISSRADIDKACAAGDYEAADKLFSLALQPMAGKMTAEHASLLREHAAVLKHLFNFTQAQNEEADAAKIEAELRKPPALVQTSSPGAMPPYMVIPPPPSAAIKSAKAYAQKHGLLPKQISKKQ